MTTTRTVQDKENEPITTQQITIHMNLMLAEKYYNYSPDDMPNEYKENDQRLWIHANRRALELGYIDSSQLRNITYAGREYMETLS